MLSDPIGKNLTLNILPYWYCRAVNFYIKDQDSDTSHRQEIVGIYQRIIEKQFQFKGNPLVRFPVMVGNQAEVIEKLKKHKIYVSDIWYDKPVIQQVLSDKILNLPTHKNINTHQATKISDLINKYAKV